MSFTFTHDGQSYRLDTEGGEVHCVPIDPQQEEQPMETSEEE